VIEYRVDASDLQRLTRALRSHEDGKALRRGLTKEIRGALAPAVAEAKSAILGMSSSGLSEGGSLRTAIARQIKAEARLSGRSAGARVKAKKRGMPRGFANAPKRTNRAAGWRHPVYGRDAWVQQLGKPGWFDDSMQGNRAAYRAAVIQAMGNVARQITRRV